MQVCTDVIDVFSDGIIIKLKLKTESLNVTIVRKEPDQNFVIE